MLRVACSEPDKLNEPFFLGPMRGVAVKGGSRLPDELELERALVDVTAPASATA